MPARALARVSGLLPPVAIALAAGLVSRAHGGPVLLYALLLGLALHPLADRPRLQPGLEFASRALLRLGVALLGARITAAQIADLGPVALWLVPAAVVATIAFGLLVSRLLRRPPEQGVLSGGAVAICGASAALALSAVLPRSDAQQRFTLLTVVGVTTLSTIAMVAYPLLATALDLGQHETAIFLGGTIHDVAQVVGAGFTISPRVGEAATFVKLLRVSMLVPVVLALGWLARRRPVDGDGDAAAPHGGNARPAGPPLMPVFLVGFVLLAAANSLGWVPEAAGAVASDASRACLVVAISALGLRTSFVDLARLGWQPVALLAAETLFLAGFVLGALALIR